MVLTSSLAPEPAQAFSLLRLLFYPEECLGSSLQPSTPTRGWHRINTKFYLPKRPGPVSEQTPDPQPIRKHLIFVFLSLTYLLNALELHVILTFTYTRLYLSIPFLLCN